MPVRRNRRLKPSAVYFTDEQLVRLPRLARDRRVTQSAIIRAGVDRVILELEASSEIPTDVLLHMRRPYADAPPTPTGENEPSKRNAKAGLKKE